MNVCLNFGASSVVGNSRYRCLALCQLIDDADRVVHRNRVATFPDRYYLVRDDRLVIVRYLLIYRNQELVQF
jgi:hypothetical protein